MRGMSFLRLLRPLSPLSLSRAHRPFSLAAPSIGTRYNTAQAFNLRLTLPARTRQALRVSAKVGGIASLALAFSACSQPELKCDGPLTSSQGSYAAPPPPPPPPSTVNMYELSFGTVCGICAGIFIKKGLKALAFLLGGIYVLLQYLHSQSVVRVDWGRVASSFENRFYSTDPASGIKRPPTVVAIWNRLVDFLTANFQQRASFLAGLMLGFRLG